MRFEACAESYEAHAAPQLAFAARVAEFTRVMSEERVVELGAGTGALTRHLCEQGGVAILATDVAPAMVRCGRAAVSGARWSILDAFGDRVPEATLQVSSGLLQWAEEPARVLRSWGASLAAGGRMVHAFPCEPCLKEWRELVPQTPVRWRDETEWNEQFEMAGLRVERRALWIEPMHFSSALDLVRAMHRSGVTGSARLGPGRLREAVRRYEALHRNGAGVVSTWAWLAVEARR